MSDTSAKPLKGAARKVAIGCTIGILIAILTTVLFRKFVERLELFTYDFRTSWKISSSRKSDRFVDWPPDIYIIDIDDYSQQQLGAYWNWDRSLHARLIDTLGKHSPAALAFDILFFDPEDHNHRKRAERLLDRAEKLSGVPLSDTLRKSILSTIDYDDQLVESAVRTGVVHFGMKLSNTEDYPPEAAPLVSLRSSLEWHRALHPPSCVADSSTSSSVLPEFRKPLIDGIFPELARAGRDLGFLNMIPDHDGVFRTIPVLMAFGENGPLYLPMSIRTVASLFGTPSEEIIVTPGKHLDIGTPFKAVMDSSGLSFSYPGITPVQVRALIEKSGRILAMPPGGFVDITSALRVGTIPETGRPGVLMKCGHIPDQVVRALGGLAESTWMDLDTGDTSRIGEALEIARIGQDAFKVHLSSKDTSYEMQSVDLYSLSLVRDIDLQLAAGTPKNLLFDIRVTNRNGYLVSTIPVLRGKTLSDLLQTPWTSIDQMPQGMRMEFGSPVRIPVTFDNRAIINFVGPRRTFPYVSYSDIIQGQVPPHSEGKLFIVGSSAAALFDMKPVPHDRYFPGVEIHASIVNSLLTGNFVRRLGTWADLAILITLAAIVGMVALGCKPVLAGIGSILLLLAYWALAMTLFSVEGLWITMARPALSIVITYTVAMAYRYLTEERDRLFLQRTFKQYLSPELIDLMYERRQVPVLGGELGIRTAFFTDIEGFSTLSEQLGSPARLVELLNEYLTAMTDILLSRFGTLDKYEGDAIIAFFGAPMHMDDHATQACHAALDMQAKLSTLREHWKAQSNQWPEIVHGMRMRVGINTGPIMTGNMGSRLRMNYTMMGDAVNLAARLESAAKQYGVYTLISQNTLDHLTDEFITRRIDKIAVVGKAEPVVVYELVCRKTELSPEQSQLLERFGAGLELFYKQQWNRAIETMLKAEELEPYRHVSSRGVSPSRRIIEYCTQFRSSPPAPDWDGVIALTSK